MASVSPQDTRHGTTASANRLTSAEGAGGRTRSPSGRVGRRWLLVAFTFAVVADPVSSVAYAIEAALRALGGDLTLLLPTMLVVVLVIAIVVVNYQQLIVRFPRGGGAPAATGAAFGEAWAFLPIGALVVDFVLTIAVSVAAGASAVIAVLPALAPARVPLAFALLLAVAGPTWYGHFGRLAFAAMTLLFLGCVLAVAASGFLLEPVGSPVPSTSVGRARLPASRWLFQLRWHSRRELKLQASAIAQLGQLDDRGRRRFGRITLWLTLGIVGTLTLVLTMLAVRLGIGIPPEHMTQMAELAQATSSLPVFAAFQFSASLLLLAAASSSFQAGPGLLKALARRRSAPATRVGILPGFLGTTNRHHTPYWGVVVSRWGQRSSLWWQVAASSSSFCFTRFPCSLPSSPG